VDVIAHVYPWPLNRWARLAALLWSLPLWLAGVPILLALALHGATVRRSFGVLEVDATSTPFGAWMFSRGWGGFACLPCVVYWCPDPFFMVSRHERTHLRQQMALGALFPVVYFALLVAYGYRRHPLEVAARRAAGELP
jgi:hypothetical protein